MRTRRRHTWRVVMVAALASILVYGVLLFLADWKDAAAALASLPLGILAGVFALTPGNFLLRAIRLRILLRAAGGDIGWADAAYIHFSGMTMAITPGKVGEVLKAFLAERLAGVPVAGGVAVVLAERLFDLFAVLALAFGGASLVGGSWPLAIVSVAAVAGAIMLSRPRPHEVIVGLLERVRWTRRHVHHAETLLANLHATLRPRPVLVSFLLSAAAWALEGVAFFLLLDALGFPDLGVGGSIAVYAVATVIGALAMLPGGVGLTEGSMMGVLVASGATGDVAFAATLVIRVATLWFAVGLGWAVFASRPQLMRRFLQEDPDLPAPRPAD